MAASGGSSSPFFLTKAFEGFTAALGAGFSGVKLPEWLDDRVCIYIQY